MVQAQNDDQWRSKLTPKQYEVLRLKATEQPFTGEYVHHNASGMYTCVACGAELFSSSTKFESGSGWPSFYDVAHNDAVDLVPDNSHGMERIEVQCHQCGGHLGHIFDDAHDQPTGKRYCINSCVLDFKPTKNNAA